MTLATLESLEILKNNVDYLQLRIEDWHQNGKGLKSQMIRYREEYRQKICVNCTNEQKKVRQCHVFPGFDSNGNLKRSCGHMCKAESNKFREKIYTQIEFHPIFYNPK